MLEKTLDLSVVFSIIIKKTLDLDVVTLTILKKTLDRSLIIRNNKQEICKIS